MCATSPSLSRSHFLALSRALNGAQERLDAYCNEKGVCDITDRHCDTPFVALNDYDEDKKSRAWRCYSPSTLNKNHTAYEKVRSGNAAALAAPTGEGPGLPSTIVCGDAHALMCPVVVTREAATARGTRSSLKWPTTATRKSQVRPGRRDMAPIPLWTRCPSR